MVISIGGYERCLLLIVGGQGNLMITLESIHKAHPWVPIRGIYQLIDLRHGEWVFRACLVQISKINTHPSFAILLFYHHGIRSCLLQPLNLLPNGFDVLLSRSPRLLLLRRE